MTSLATISGMRSSPSPNSPNNSRFHSWAPRLTASERLAVVASVTNSPVSRFSSQTSDVVTTPPVSTCRRSHAIFGAEKYASSTNPVSAVRASAWSANSAHTDSARRSCHPIACVSGCPVFGSHANTVSP